MRVNGEAYFLINGWMDFLSLLLTARLASLRFRPGRAALAAAFGAGYALLSYGLWPALRSIPVLAAAALIMAAAVWGARGLKACPLLLASCMMLSGLADFLWKRGVPSPGILTACGLCVLFLIRLYDRIRSGSGEKLALRISWRGRSACLPALRDSGNLLRDPVTGLPVIMAPARSIAPLLPGEEIPAGWTDLPRGFRLIHARTAAGEGTYPCFHPDAVTIVLHSRAADADAVIALSDGGISRALVPDAFFCKEEVEFHAGL